MAMRMRTTLLLSLLAVSFGLTALSLIMIRTRAAETDSPGAAYRIFTGRLRPRKPAAAEQGDARS